VSYESCVSIYTKLRTSSTRVMGRGMNWRRLLQVFVIDKFASSIEYDSASESVCTRAERNECCFCPHVTVYVRQCGGRFPLTNTNSPTADFTVLYVHRGLRKGIVFMPRMVVSSTHDTQIDNYWVSVCFCSRCLCRSLAAWNTIFCIKCEFNTQGYNLSATWINMLHWNVYFIVIAFWCGHTFLNK